MSIAEKYGFTIHPATADSPAVEWYRKDHLAHYGYPDDVELSSTAWYGVVREDSVYGVVGIRPHTDKIIEVPDFFFQRNRWGKLAAYAALEIIRKMADELDLEVITATPVWNDAQMRATKKVFDLDGPSHYVFRYKGVKKPAEVAV